MVWRFDSKGACLDILDDSGLLVRGLIFIEDGGLEGKINYVRRGRKVGQLAFAIASV